MEGAVVRFRKVGPVFVSLVIFLGGCASGHSGTAGLAAVKSGRYLGVSWWAFAGYVNGQFCMELRHVTGRAPRPFAGACVFDDEPSKNSYYFATGPGPHGSYVNYGPLPPNAVFVRIATHQTVRSYRLPSGHGLPPGRFWIDFEPETWPTPAEGRPLQTPQPLDRHGNPVNFQPF